MNRRDYLKISAASIAGIIFSHTSHAKPIGHVVEHPQNINLKGFEDFCINHVRLHGFEPLRLFDYQKRLVNTYSENKLVILKKFRAGGFSTVSGLWVLYNAFENKSNCGILCKRKVDAEHFQNSLNYLLCNLSYKNKKTAMKMEFEGGGKLHFHYPNSVRGHALDVLMMDESAYWKNATKTWNDIYPIVACGAKLCVVSTPYKREGWFYDTYNDACRGRNLFKVFHASADEYPKYSKIWLNKCRKLMPKQDYQREILQNFVA